MTTEEEQGKQLTEGAAVVLAVLDELPVLDAATVLVLALAIVCSDQARPEFAALRVSESLQAQVKRIAERERRMPRS